MMIRKGIKMINWIKRKYGCDLKKYEKPLLAYKKHCKDAGTEFGITATDNNLFYIIDGYHNGLLRQIIKESVPDSLPFIKGRAIRIFWNDFSYEPEAADFDTVGIYYVSEEFYGMKNPIPIHRYFRRPVDAYEAKYGYWLEITEEKYNKRFQAASSHVNKGVDKKLRELFLEGMV